MCTPGTYTNATGMSQCLDCAAWFASKPQQGRSMCDLCSPFGRTLIRIQRAKQLVVLCQFGSLSAMWRMAPKFARIVSTGLVDVCDRVQPLACQTGILMLFFPFVGSNQPVAGSIEICDECKVGLYQGTRGQSFCFECARGTFSTTNGSIKPVSNVRRVPIKPIRGQSSLHSYVWPVSFTGSQGTA